MKQVLMLLLAACICLPLNIQGQKSKSKTVSIRDINIPSNPFEGEFKTFTVRIKDEGMNFSKYGLSRIEFRSLFENFKTFNRVDAKGDFSIKVSFYGDNSTSADTESYKVTEGKGDDKKEVTKWKYSFGVRAPISYEILDAAGNVMRAGDIRSFDDVETIDGKGYASSGAVKLYLKDNYDRLVKNKVSEIANQAVKSFANSLRRQTDVYDYSKVITLHTMKKAEKYGMEEFDKYFDAAESVLKEKVFSAAMLEQLAPAMEFWKNGLTKFSPKDKKQREAFFACANNLAQLYFLSKQMDFATGMIEKMRLTDENTMAVNSFERMVKSRMDDLAANEAVEMKFLNYAQAGPTAASDDDVSEPLRMGYVMKTDGEKIEGEVRLRMKQGEARVVDDVHVILSDGSSRRYKPANVKEIMIDGTEIALFELLPFNYAPMERVVSNDRALLAKEYNVDPREATYAVFDIVSKKILLPDVALNINKAILKKFGDCNSVKVKAEAESYSRDTSSLEDLVNDMGACEN